VRRTVALLMVLLVALAAPIPVARAAPTGDVTGTFGINAPPTIDSVSLTQVSMTPQVEYTVSVQISDPDTINDLATVVLKLWYDGNSGAPLEAEFDAVTADANAQTAAVDTWTADDAGGTTYTGSAVLTPAATTWAQGVDVLPVKGGGQAPGDFALTTFTYQFLITVGKVATETTGADRWQLAAKATDTQGQTGYGADGEAATMDFYGEIIVPGATVAFGDLGPGTDFAINNQPVGVTISLIANGAYDEKISSSASWAGNTFSASLDATGATALAQEFALRAEDTATIGTAVLVDNVGVTFNDTGGQTLEAGVPETTYNLWLRLAASFNKDTYSGTITFIIANGI
jgi:hypothetical protein